MNKSQSKPKFVKNPPIFTESVFKDYAIAFNKSIGMGSFGRVYLGKKIKEKSHHSHDFFAVKEILKNTLNIAEEQNLYEEIKTQRNMHHRGIVELYDTFEDENSIYLFMEYSSKGTLADYIKKKGTLNEPKIKDFAHQIGEAMSYIDSKNRVHQDLKPENIVLTPHQFDGKIILKLIDFGLAKQIALSTNAAAEGTLMYMAPEKFLKEE